VTEKQLIKTVNVAANPDEVWRAWTTVEGIKTFFGPEARVELRPGGPYEIYFDIEQPEGLKGSEGCKVLSFVPSRMLSFTWGAPPKFPRARKETAQWVVLFFEPSGDGTLVTLIELGWKDGEESDAVYQYFDRAWVTVLSLLARSFSTGPADWSNPLVPPRPFRGRTEDSARSWMQKKALYRGTGASSLISFSALRSSHTPRGILTFSEWALSSTSAGDLLPGITDVTAGFARMNCRAAALRSTE
jgi:uncharacterized protein YndB with AHSA1/START domain